jgi:hypothetical protein
MQEERTAQYRPALKKRTSYNYKALVLGLAVAAVLAIALIIWGTLGLIHRQKWPDPVLVSAAHSAYYPIYYPTELPKGFSPTIETPKVSADVFIYSLSYDGNKKLFVSAIPRPSGVQFSDFYNRVLSNKTSVLNPAGTAVIGTANNQPIGSLVTTKTWVTVNAPKGIDTQRLQALVASLKQL